jgi:hypothetical protein
MDTESNKTQTPQKEAFATKPIVRTYQSDVARALKEKKGSVVDIAAAEEKRRQEQGGIATAYDDTAIKKNRMLAFAIFFVVVGVGVFGYLFFTEKQKETTKTETGTPIVSSIIFVNTQKEIPIDEKEGDALVSEIAKEIVGANIRLDFMEQFFFTKTEGTIKTIVPAGDFSSLVFEHIPPTLIRSFEKEYLVGVHAFNGNTPFFLARLNFFENAFSGMLKWERFMADDILPFFGKTNTPKTLGGNEAFEDYVLMNQDTRVLRDSLGDIVLLYAFPDRKTLVITTDQDTFKEIIDRLKTPKPVVQ